MSYQSFSDVPAASHSSGKLKAIQLPDDLTGMSVLDLGCNEGFFCHHAKMRGATRVVGIDRSAEVIASARERARQAGLDIEFIVGDVTNLDLISNEKFDIILIMSMLHYVASPARLFKAVHNALSETGTLILEAGVILSNDQTIIRTLRSVDECFFPTFGALEHNFMREFTVRRIGESVPQPGDRIPRVVFHCKKRLTTVLMILGEGGSGKTVLSHQFVGQPVIFVDDLLHPVRSSEWKRTPEQETYDAAVGGHGDISAAWNEVAKSEGVRRYFAKMIASAVAQFEGVPMVIVEGFVLSSLADAVREELGTRYKCWKAQTA